MQQSVARQCTGKGHSCSSDLDLISLILILDPDIVKKMEFLAQVHQQLLFGFLHKDNTLI